MSGLTIKSAQISIQPASTQSDEEVAACVAAIYAVLDAEQLESTSSPEASQSSKWLQASRLQATGNKVAASGAGSSLWRKSGLPVLAFLLALFLSSGKVEAQNSSYKHIYVKVGLCLDVPKLTIEATDGAEIRDVQSGQLVGRLNPQSQWSVNSDAKSICLQGKKAGDLASVGDNASFIKVAYFPTAPRLGSNSLKLPVKAQIDDQVTGYLVVPPKDTGVVTLNGKLYRGAMWLRSGAAGPGTVSAVNIIDIEDYLISVLPGEMPSGWSCEALKAQAVAARSYAVANIGKHSKDGYDVKSTIEDQVYLGIASESPASNLAVAQTEGIILKHRGKAISAFFHSTSGGSTEVAENVWGHPVTYLKSVPDFDDSSPHFSWVRSLKVDDVEHAMQPSIGQVTGMFVVSRTDSNRVKQVMVNGTSGVALLSGEALRRLFKLPSTNFNIGYKENCYELAGRGSGHGLGLSQWGAKSLAEHGYNAAQILTYYYKDVTLDYLSNPFGI